MLPQQTGCYELYLKNMITGETARVLSNSLTNACIALEWDLKNVRVDGAHETYGKVLERDMTSEAIFKSSDDKEMLKYCF